MAWFNSIAGYLFSMLVVYLRRRYGDVQYARAAECQDGKRRADGQGRRALHFHVLARVERWRDLERDFRKGDPHCALRQLVERWGFGHEIRLELARPDASFYCAKYVSKTATVRDSMPWLDRRTGEVTYASRYRPWSASRRWGSTMKAIKQAQAAWAIAQAALTVAEATEAAHAGAEGAGALDPNTASSTGRVVEQGVIEWKEASL